MFENSLGHTSVSPEWRRNIAHHTCTAVISTTMWLTSPPYTGEQLAKHLLFALIQSEFRQ